MKKALAVLLVVAVLLGCAACQQETQESHICYYSCLYCRRCTNAACTEQACLSKCQGHHFCESQCSSCGRCTDKACTEDACMRKCAGHHFCIYPCPTCGLCIEGGCEDPLCPEKCQGHQEEPYEFPSGDYITTEPVVIDTGTFVYHIPENVYVRGDLQELTNIIVPVMEQVSGLTFAGNGYGREIYPDGKIHLTVTREGLGTDEYGAPHSEIGPYVPDAHPTEHVQNLSPGELFVCDNAAIVHETAHMLMFRQSAWVHCQLLDESISTYTEYLVAKELETLNTSEMFYFDYPDSVLLTYSIDAEEYEVLFDKPLEYWFENWFEDGWNGNYSIGFRFSAYLHETYGSYTKWVTEFENTYCYRTRGGRQGGNSTIEQQIEVLKATYGEDVLDGFYPWLKENLERFEPTEESRDLTKVEGINLYPIFNGIQSLAVIRQIEYDDLYINLEVLRTYIEDYKKLEASPLVFKASADKYGEPILVNLYRADGSYTTVVTDTEISLEGISYIKLVGAGTLYHMRFDGPFTWTKSFD